MPSITNRTYLFLLLVGSIVVTIAIGLIWWSPDQRDANFYVNLIFMCFSEFVLFGWPLMSSEGRRDDTFLMGMGMWGVSWAYLFTVFIIALISKFTADYKFSLTANLIIGFLLAVLMVSWTFSSRHVVSVGAERASARNVMDEMKSMAASLSAQLSMQTSSSIIEACESVIEEIKYARSNSTSESAVLDTKLINSMTVLLDLLKPSAGSTDDQIMTEKSIIAAVSKIKSLLAERESLLKMSR